MIPYLELVVFFLEFAAEFLELLFERCCLVEFVAAVIFVLLQLVTAFLVLDAFAFESLHLSQQVRTSFGQMINLLEVVHPRGLAV